MTAVAAVQRWVRKAGLEVRRFAPEASYAAAVAAVCRQQQIDLVLDVGANVGQFALDLRATGYEGLITSFEPLDVAWRKLGQVAMSDEQWFVHPRCALGAERGSVDINVSANSVSSSILPMLPAHLDAAPESAYHGIETVPVFRLDEVVSGYLSPTTKALLKIDTQGYEWSVLDGALELLADPGLRAVSLELSLVPLYEGQKLWLEVIERLDRAGLALWAISPSFSDRATGRTLQLDGIFCRD